MLHSLQGKLVLTLVVLLLANSGFFIVVTMMSTRLHLQMVEQSLNYDLAERIIDERWLGNASASSEESTTAFDRLMRLNPDIEIYRIDSRGTILDYSAPAGRVVRDRISLEPVTAFLSKARSLPIAGDDPRSRTESKIFSVAPARWGDGTEGYLYVVLGGEIYSSVVRMLQSSHVLRLSVGLAIGGALLTTVLGVAFFFLLTRRFRELSREMTTFQDNDFRKPVELSVGGQSILDDEIDAIRKVFRAMCTRIHEQFSMLESADRARRDMIADMSHDLRTPLATLRGYLETILIKENDLNGADRRRYVERSLEHAERISRQIEELLDLSTLDMSDVALDMVQFSIAELVQDVAEEWSLEAQRRGIELIAEISPRTPFVVGDIRLVERVLENLLENALRFTPEGGSVRLTISPGDGCAMVRIDDSGPGIENADLPRIFERFYQAESARFSAGNGVGLGLAIARRIVELHQGDIGASRREKGASFFFSLPSSQSRDVAG